jgi:hypothetical protein
MLEDITQGISATRGDERQTINKGNIHIYGTYGHGLYVCT